jgi:histidinol-phosphatase
MDHQPSDLTALLDFAAQIAREAGEITLRHFRRLPAVERKSDGSFVTVADRESERFLRDAVTARFPDDAILGEEEGERAGSSGRRWILDPIDGTFSFVHGVPLYGVLVGVEVGDEPTVGVINIPALGEMVYAARGLGCYWNGGRARVSETSSLDEALLLASEFRPSDGRAVGEDLARLQNRVGARRTWGDCYGHLLVATGRAEMMLDPVMKIWDCAALLPVVEEAGGVFTDWRGRRTIRGGSAVSTNAALAGVVRQILSGSEGGADDNQ